MNDDLISRKALLKELREIMDEPHNTMFLMGIGAAVSIVEHRETAFDKGKVLEELKKHADIAIETNEAYGSEVAFGEWSAYKQAEEIVKKGGIE